LEDLENDNSNEEHAVPKYSENHKRKVEYESERQYKNNVQTN